MQGLIKNRKITWLVLAIILVVAVFWLVFVQGVFKNGLDTKTSYQAVFLTNEQVYFGKLSADGGMLVLSDVFYLQTAGQLQPVSDSEFNLQLVKLGSELHGPQDMIYFERSNVLFWENMKNDSQVVKAIQKYQEGGK